MLLWLITPNTERPDPTGAASAPADFWREQGPRSAVIQEDAALAVADQHALLQLGHQRREAVLLGLDARFRRLNRLFDFAFQLARRCASTFTAAAACRASSEPSSVMRYFGFDAAIRCVASARRRTGSTDRSNERGTMEKSPPMSAMENSASRPTGGATATRQRRPPAWTRSSQTPTPAAAAVAHHEPPGPAVSQKLRSGSAPHRRREARHLVKVSARSACAAGSSRAPCGERQR